MVSSKYQTVDSDVKDDKSLDTIQFYGEPLRTKAFDLPLSCFLGVESREALRNYSIALNDQWKKIKQFGFSWGSTPIDDIPALRQRDAEIVCASQNYINMANRYSVSMRTEIISGVYTEVFTPNDGVTFNNRERVLINLHGGSFISGARSQSHLESIPIADLGKVKVISVDYRMGPEHQFPAASNDVVAVYKALLQVYKPANIGIYGCSAGALLTAQTVALLQQEGLPLPGAVGMLCGAAYYWNDGDSGYFVEGIGDYDEIESSQNNLYLKGVAYDNALAFPGKSTEILKSFPPSLCIGSTRDFALSAVVYTHSQLTKVGVEADLHVWEGLNHAFIYDADLPESREAYDVVVNFFNKYLGKS